MVTLVELLQRVYEELVEVHAAETSVSESGRYVDVLDRDAEIRTPFFGFEWDISGISRGMGGNRRTVELQSSSGEVTKTVARDYELMLDISVIVDGDEPRQRTELMQAVTSRFSEFIHSPSELHTDLHRIREQQTVPSPSGDTGDTSAVSTFSLEYVTYDTDTVPAAETVTFDLNADNTDAYPEQY